jgi:hypothetical protein
MECEFPIVPELTKLKWNLTLVAIPYIMLLLLILGGVNAEL